MKESTTIKASPRLSTQLRVISSGLFDAFGEEWESKSKALALLEKEFGGKFARDVWWMGQRVGLCAQSVERIEYLLGSHVTEIGKGGWIRYQQDEV